MESKKLLILAIVCGFSLASINAANWFRKEPKVEETVTAGKTAVEAGKKAVAAGKEAVDKAHVAAGYATEHAH